MAKEKKWSSDKKERKISERNKRRVARFTLDSSSFPLKSAHLSLSSAVNTPTGTPGVSNNNKSQSIENKESKRNGKTIFINDHLKRGTNGQRWSECPVVIDHIYSVKMVFVQNHNVSKGNTDVYQKRRNKFPQNACKVKYYLESFTWRKTSRSFCGIRVDPNIR